MGSINIDNTGSGGAITLSSDGTSLLLGGSAVGGGADLYAANESSPSAQPSATGANAIALGDSAVASGSKSIALGYKATATANFSTAFAESRAAGEYSFAAGIANDSTTYGASGPYAISIGYQSRAKANQSVALGSSAYVDSDSSRGLALGENAYVEQCDYGTAIGAAARVHGGNTITEAMALGSSYASGASSFAAAITNNTSTYGASGANSVAIGQLAKAAGTSSVAIGSGAVAATNESIALGLNATVGTSTRGTALGYSANATGSQATAISDSTASGGNSFAAVADATASATDSIAIGRAATASSTYATAIGKNSSDQGSVATSGTAAMALGGSYASGTNSFAAAIANNTSTYGAQNTNGIAIGSLAKAHDSAYAIAIGRNNISSGGSGCTAIGGMNNEALGTSSIITGGAYCSITGAAQYARAGGGYSKAAVHGKDVFASGQFSSVGDAQGAKFILRADTTDATATVLTTNNGTPASWNQIVAASDTCITFDGTITAMQNGAQAYASFRIEGLLVNDGGTTTLANSATTVIDNQSSWVMALSADNTNNALAITCTGEASHNIRWVANIRTTEVTYA